MTELLKWVVCIAAAYLIGTIPAGWLIVKWRYGKDLRLYGSGQVGGSNVYHSFSKKLGAGVILFDIVKGVLVISVAWLLKLDLAHQVFMGLAVIAGHDWPVFLHFNAGRGVATSIGVSICLFPQGLPLFVLLLLLTLVLHSSPIPVLLAFFSLPLSSLVLGKPLLLTIGLLLVFLILVTRRLTVPCSRRFGKINTGQLLINRFLFDRDIRDARAWMQYRPNVPPEK